MFLRTLSIKNVRSVAELTIDFSSPADEARAWTILLGENGTGKSTVLRAAALVLGGSDALPVLLPDPAAWVRTGSKAGVIEAQVATAEGAARTFTLEIQKRDTISTMVKRNDQNLRQLDDALRHASRSYFVAGYGASRRLPGPEQAPFRSENSALPRSLAVASLFSRDATLRALDEWAMDLHYRKKNAGLRLLRETMAELLPDVTFDRIDRAARRVLFRTPDGSVPLQQLSDGYQNVAGWCGDLLFRITETFQDYQKPLEARGLLLLDEIDLHLHPVWQRQLLRFLRSKLPNFQVLATTHSPFTAQQAPEGALHILERPARGQPVAVRAYAGDPRLLRVEQLLEPLLGLETSESLSAESKRHRHRELKARKRLDRAEKKELAVLNGEVAALPQAQAITPEDKKRLALLARIEHRLGPLPEAANGTVRKRS